MTAPETISAQDARRELADELVLVAECDIRECARDLLIGVPVDCADLRGWADLMDKAAVALRAEPARGAEEMEARIDKMEDALHDIVRWSEAYPLTVFPEPDLKKARALLEAGGMTLDSLSAHAMRHVVEGVGKIARRALTLPQGNEGGGDA